MDTRFTVRPLTATDLPGLLAVQHACYGEGYLEPAEVFARRIACPVQCSQVAVAQGVVVAYLAAYRSRRGKVTPLHGDFEATTHPDTLYLHDMAVHPEWAGRGLARALLAPVWKLAQHEGLAHSSLVSVQGSEAYWARQGFAVVALTDVQQQQRLAGYGPEAVYMERPL
ncbi:MAG: GNAT family N-acetyltransferase [Burkholderiaceae bacterium]